VADRTTVVTCEILLVDDSEIVTESVKRWLKHEGYEVVVTRNCAEARAAAPGHHFSAHIIDLELSDGHGIDLALCLKREGYSAETIFYTGHSISNHSVERARLIGHVVVKGQDPGTLLCVLRDVVRRSSCPE
jgi:DNA-binding NtrC family response regulator